jgi:ACS family tartrate transporter-like MFS transporter
MRKATWHLIPLIALGYGTAYMDRINIGYAQLQMNSDLHFSYTVFNIGAGIFFLSYAACEIPSNLLLYRFGARRWLARIMLTWGLLAMAMLFVRTPTQFYSMRFLLGMAEAGFFPGLLFRLDGHFGLRGWQWLFLVEGLPPVLLSAIFFRYLPDTPHQAKWLTLEEKQWIDGHLAEEAIDHTGTHCTGLASALRNPRVWLFGLTNLLLLGVSYASTFALPDMVRSLTGLSVASVGYILSAMGVLGAVGMVANAVLSDRSGKPYGHMIAPALLEAICLALITITVSPWLAILLLASMYLFHNAIQGPLLAIPSTFLKGKGAAAGLATINMVGILGGVIFPPLMGYLRDHSGNYRSGFLMLSAATLAATAVVFTLRTLARKRGTQAT